MIRVALAFALAALAACGSAKPLPQPTLPARILPPQMDGLEARPEPEAAKEYDTAAKQKTLVAGGSVYTLRNAGEVVGALQVVLLKAKFPKTELDVVRGIRASIERGRYRYFKLDGQWIGEQKLPELSLYVWFPPGGNHYEILVVKPELGVPKDLLRAIIAYQREGAA